MATQTVNFLPPSYITTLTSTVTSMSGSIAALNSQVTSMSGSISTLNSQVSALQANVTVSYQTGSFTAVSNYTYTLELPTLVYSASPVAVTVTFPAAPSNGDCITLNDTGRTWGNTYYNLKVNFNGKTGAGDCSNGQLFAARGGNIVYTYSAANNWWYGIAGKIAPSSSVLTINASASTSNNLPYHGWWAMGDIDPAGSIDFFSTTPNYIFIDQTQYPIKIYAFRKHDNRVVQVPGYFGTINSQWIPNPSDPTQLIQITDLYNGIAPVTNYSVLDGLKLSADKNTLSATAIRLGDHAFTFVGYITPTTRFNKVSNLSNLPELSNVSFAEAPSTASYNPFPQTPSYADPVVMAKELFNINLRFGHNGVNSTIGLWEEGLNYYDCVAALNNFCEGGVTFNSPIISVQASYSGPNNVAGGNGSTNFTDIYTGKVAHYCTPGSNVTISGFAGSWSALNGYYPNGVSFYENSVSKSGAFNIRYADATIDGSGNATGTWFQMHNKFLLIKDTSDAVTYPISTATGTYGQAVFSGSPITSVTHRFNSAMTYNEWHAAFLAILIYAFGNNTHTRFQSYLQDRALGQLYSAWNFTAGATNPVLTLRTRPTEDATSLSCSCSYINIAGYKKYVWANDPYQSQYYYNIKFQTGAQTTLTSSFITAGSPLPLNYMTGSPSQLYIGLDGTGPKSRYQNYVANLLYSATYGYVRNVSNVNLTGGNYLSAQMISRDQITGSYPNPQQWTLSTNTFGAANVTTSVNRLNYFYTSIINPVYTPGKKVGYMNLVDSGGFWFGKFGNDILAYGQFSDFNPPVSNPTLYTGALGALKCMTTVIKWFNDQGCDSIILDARTNGGGWFTYMIGLVFGGDRKGYAQYQGSMTDGYSSVTDMKNITDAFGDALAANILAQTKTSDVEANFPGGVFRGSTGAAKKIVFLTTYGRAASGGDLITRCWQGDNYDGNLGSNTYAKIMGNLDGRLCGLSPTTGIIPAANSNQRMLSAASQTQTFDLTSPIYSNVSTGPDGQRVWGHLRYPYVATQAMATGATGTFMSTLPGCTALPDSFQTTIWYDWGLVGLSPADYNARYLTADGRPQPDKTNPSTWRDIWLEQAIREACVLSN